MAFAQKAKKILKQRAFLITLAATIVGFVCVPLVAMQAFIFSQSTEEFQQTNHDYYGSVLHTTANSFENREEMLYETALRIALNETVQKPLRHNATEYTVYEAAQAINDYKNTVMFANSVGVYYVSEGYVLTDGFKYTLQEYCEKCEPEDPEAVERMKTYFTEITSMSYFASADGDVLYAARPVPLGLSGRYDGIVFFALDAGALEESYRAAVSAHTSFAIADDQGKLLLQGEDFNGKIDSNKLSSFLKAKDQVCIVGDDEELMLYKYTDPETGFSFLLTVDRGESEERVLEFAKLMRISLWVMAALVTASLVATIYINYRPINQLLKKHTAAEGRHEMHSEIERLESVFFELDKKMSTEQNMVKDFILGDLLFGNNVKPELVSQYFPADRYCSFAVLTIMCPLRTTAEAYKMAEELSKSTGHRIFVTSVPGRPHAVAVCLAEKPIESVSLRADITGTITEIFGTEYPVCMGEVVAEIFDLRASYRSAVIANVPAVLTETQENSEEYVEKLQRLTQCVYMGDEEDALNNLAEIKYFLYRNVTGEGMLRYHSFELLHTYLNSINSDEVRLSGEDVESLLAFASVEDLFERLTRSIHQVCSQVENTERDVDIRLQQRLLQYVDKNFTDSSLCLTIAADYVGSSIYTVSRLFKEMTGKGFKDYVMEKRLELGHMLLCSTPKSIADVAAEAGFDNANYFSTVFKAKYGMPPTKYRRLMKDKDKEEQPV